MAPSTPKRKRNDSEDAHERSNKRRGCISMTTPRRSRLRVERRSIDIKSRLLRVANEVALDLSKTTKWSSYHAWKSVSSLRATDEAGQFTEYEQLWTTALPYGTCVDHAYSSHRELRRRLLEIPELAPFANSVQLLAGYRKTDETGMPWASKKPDHALTVLVVDNSIVVIDVTAHPTAVLLHVGQRLALLKRTEFPNRRRSPELRYSTDFSEDGIPILSSCEKGYRQDYKPITYEDALRLIKFPNARRVVSMPAQRSSKPSKGSRRSAKSGRSAKMTVSMRGEGTFDKSHIPARKDIYFDFFMPIPPEKLMYVYTPKGYFTSWAKISVDFQKRSLGLLVPSTDWLEHPEQEETRQRLAKLNFPIKQGEVQSYIFLDLTKKKKLSERIQFFIWLCMLMGRILRPEVEQFIRDANGGQDPVL